MPPLIPCHHLSHPLRVIWWSYLTIWFLTKFVPVTQFIWLICMTQYMTHAVWLIVYDSYIWLMLYDSKTFSLWHVITLEISKLNCEFDCFHFCVGYNKWIGMRRLGKVIIISLRIILFILWEKFKAIKSLDDVQEPFYCKTSISSRTPPSE